MGKLIGKRLVTLILICGIAGGAWLVYKRSRERLALPELSFQDLNPSRQAGSFERVSGQAYTRVSGPEDFKAAQISPNPSPSGSQVEKSSGWSVIQAGSPILLGALFHLRPQSQAQLMTAGNWLIAMDGEGEFIMEDARTNADHTSHTSIWYVKQGVFRAKPHDYDPSEHSLEVRTPIARVLVKKGEIGLRISEGGGGQVWLMSGSATILWNDGRRKELPLKGMDYL